MSLEEYLNKEEQLQYRIDMYEYENCEHQIQMDLNNKEICKLRQDLRELRKNYSKEADL